MKVYKQSESNHNGKGRSMNQNDRFKREREYRNTATEKYKRIGCMSAMEIEDSIFDSNENSVER